MRARTSRSSPLLIASLPAGAGTVGITLCPGKRGESLAGPRWERDLDADLDVVAAWGAGAVVTLIEDHEFELLQVTGLPAGVRARGLAWYHLPITDVRAPDERFERGWRRAWPELRERIDAGGKLLVHCRGGLGRAGTVAALVLVECGTRPQQAIDAVRAARPGAIETDEQAQWLLRRPGGTP